MMFWRPLVIVAKGVCTRPVALLQLFALIGRTTCCHFHDKSPHTNGCDDHCDANTSVNGEPKQKRFFANKIRSELA